VTGRVLDVPYAADPADPDPLIRFRGRYLG
jgi:hypothetical protein